jgi:hypothetical protein
VNEYVCLVFTNAAVGREHDFNTWYDDVHLREVVDNLPGYVAGQRYRLHPLQRPGGRASTWTYLAEYEVRTDDLAASNQAVEDFKAAGGFTSPDGALAAEHAAWFYAPTAPLVTEQDVGARTKPQLGAARHVFLALTNASPGREEEFDRWYDVHVPEVVAEFPGLVNGRHHERADRQRDGMSPPFRNLARYDLHADDVGEYHRLDREARESGRLTPHAGALDPGYAVWVYSEIGPRVPAAR